MADHLRPTAPIAPDALLPGDPGRALALAQELLESPRMANHARGLWGYSGLTDSGRELTIQATGLGGPSVAVVLAELAELGVKRAIRIGTCRALDAGLEPGDLLVAEAAIAADGAGAALSPSGRIEPEPALTAALLAAPPGLSATTVASTDLHYDPDAEARGAEWRAAGASVVDLGTAATLAVGRAGGVEVASALVVVRSADGRELTDEQVEARSLQLGRAAATALGRVFAGPTQPG